MKNLWLKNGEGCDLKWPKVEKTMAELVVENEQLCTREKHLLEIARAAKARCESMQHKDCACCVCLAIQDAKNAGIVIEK